MARKSAAVTVKKSKVQSWENFLYKLEYSFWQADKVFWPTILRLFGKISNVARTKEDQIDVLLLLSNDGDMLGRWRRYFKDLLNPAIVTPSDTQEVQLGKGNTNTATDVLKAGKAPSFYEIRPGMPHRAMNRGVNWLTRMCQIT